MLLKRFTSTFVYNFFFFSIASGTFRFLFFQLEIILYLCIHVELILYYLLSTLRLSFKRFTSEKTVKKQGLSILVIYNNVQVKRFNNIF
jgi:hypothetical protein